MGLPNLRNNNKTSNFQKITNNLSITSTSGLDLSDFKASGAVSHRSGSGDNISALEKLNNAKSELSGSGSKVPDLTKAIKVKDYLPGGKENQPVWQGISLNNISSLGSIKSGLLNQGLNSVGLGKLSSIITIKGDDGLNVNKHATGLEQTYTGKIHTLSGATVDMMNSDAVNSLHTFNNNQMIKQQFPFIGGLTSKGLDKSMKVVVNGQLLTPEEAQNYAKLGLVSKNMFATAMPTADSISMSWGEAFKKAITNPTFIGTATTTIIGNIPYIARLRDKLSDKAGDVVNSLQLTEDEILNIHTEQDLYVAGLKAIYRNMGEPATELASLYKYYKINMIAHNDPKRNPDGTGFNLGQEVADSFFGSVNYNVTSFIDGASDYVSETWQNVSQMGAGWVKDQFDSFQNFSEAFAGATGIELQLNPEFQDKVYDIMDRLGFGNRGIGTDTKAYITTTLIQKTYVTIKSKGNKVTVTPNSVLYYYERHEYRSKLTAERRVKVRLTNAQLSTIDLSDPDLQVTVNRRYGFALGQSPSGTYPPDYATEMTEVERDAIYEWPAKVVNDKTNGKKEDQAKKVHKQTKSASEPNDPKSMFIQQDVEFILTPPLLVGNHTDQMFNGIAEGENSISEIINMAFQTSYETGVICPAKPKNDFVLKDVPIPPTNFEGLLTQFQKEYDIYEGGFVIYHDRLAIDSESKDVYFVLPKRGVVDMEFDAGWTVELRVRNINTPNTPDMLCFIEPSRKKIIWPITEQDLSTPGNATDLQQQGVARYSKGSVIGAQQPADKKTITTEVVQTNTEYLVPNEQKNTEYRTIYVRIPNAMMTFTPGDMVTLKWNGEELKGNVKEWAAQEVQGVRIILLVLIMEKAPEKTSWIDKLSPGNFIEKMQEKVAGMNAKITNKLNTYADKTGDWLQNQFETFSKWEDEHLQFKGHNILEWLNMVDPNIEMPELNQEALHANTEVEYLQNLFDIKADDPFQSMKELTSTGNESNTDSRIQTPSMAKT